MTLEGPSASVLPCCDEWEFAWYCVGPILFLLLSADVLAVKFLRESRRGAVRKFSDLALDSSKQLAGLLCVHTSDLALALLVKLFDAGSDACAWYCLFLMVESTFGVFLEWFCVLRWTTWLIRQWYGQPIAQEAFSGVYDGELAGEAFDLVAGGGPALQIRYKRQLLAWLAIVGSSHGVAAALALLLGPFLYPAAKSLRAWAEVDVAFALMMMLAFSFQLLLQDFLLVAHKEHRGYPPEARLDMAVRLCLDKAGERVDWALNGFWLAETAAEAAQRQAAQDKASQSAAQGAQGAQAAAPDGEAPLVLAAAAGAPANAAAPPQTSGPAAAGEEANACLERVLRWLDEYLNESSRGVKQLGSTIQEVLEAQIEEAVGEDALPDQLGPLTVSVEGPGLMEPLLGAQPGLGSAQSRPDWLAHLRSFMWRLGQQFAAQGQRQGKKLMVLLMVSSTGAVLLTASAWILTGCHGLGGGEDLKGLVCPIIMPVFLYKVLVWLWCIPSGFGWGVWGSGREQFVAFAAARTASWFWLMSPLRALIRGLNRWVFLESWPFIGDALGTLASMEGPPVTMPYFGVDVNAQSQLTWEQQRERAVFWSFLLGLKVFILLFSTWLWHKLLIQYPFQRQKLGTPRRDHWSPVRLTRLFVYYHLIHNLFLFLLVQAAVVNGFINLHFGLDWELWGIWIDWLIICLNLTAVVKYSANRGTLLRQSFGDIFMLLMPGFGNDIHLAKDWIFAGFCFQQAFSTTSIFGALFAYFLALASILSLFLPLPELLRDEDAKASFISSHWPIIMALPEAEKIQDQDESFEMESSTWREEVEQELQHRAGISSSSSQRVRFFDASGAPIDKEDCGGVSPPVYVTIQAATTVQQGWVDWLGTFITTKVTAQTTKAKQLVAEQNELPQAVFELMFLAAFGSSVFIVVAAFFSFFKVLLIPVGRRIVVTWIQRQGDANSLVSFVQEHGDVAEWSSGSYALHLAAGAGKLSTGPLASTNRRLVKAISPLLSIPKVSGSVNKCNQQSMTPLLVAARFLEDPRVFMRVCLRLVEASADPVGFKDRGGRAPLEVLEDRGLGESWQQSCVLLRELGLFHQAVLKNDQRRAPLLWAAEMGKDGLFKLLADANANMFARGSQGRTPLHFAVGGGKPEICTILLVAKADVLATDNAGRNAAHEAAITNQSAPCSILLNVGLHNNLPAVNKLLLSRDISCGATPLHYAALSTSASVCCAILEGCKLASGSVALLLGAEDSEGKTPLHWAAGACAGRKEEGLQFSQGAVKVCLVLAAMRADLMAEDRQRKTPVDTSEGAGGIGCVRHALLNRPRVEGGDPPLTAAVKDSEAKLVRFLLDKHVDVNCQDPASPRGQSGWVALHYAASSGQHSMCKQLILGRAEVTARTETEKMNPLHLAAAAGHAEVCKLLLSERDGQSSWLGDWYRKDDMNVGDSRGSTPLLLAAGDGHADACRVLGTALHGENATEELKAAAMRAVTCAWEGACDVLVQVLLQRQGDINAKHSKFDYPLLHHAVALASEATDKLEGRRGVCRVLVERSADIIAQCEQCEGQTPLDLAVGETKVCMVKEWSSVPGTPPLAVAAAEGLPELARLLLQHRADAGVSVQCQSSKTPLHLAAAGGHCELCEILGVQAGLEAQDAMKRTALHLAAMEDQANTCIWLLGQGASREAVDQDGRTPAHLHFFFHHCNEQLCQALLKGSTVLGERDARGKTPLHYAVAGAQACDFRQRARYESVCGLLVQEDLGAMAVPDGEGRVALAASPDWLMLILTQSSGVAGVPTLHRAVAEERVEVCKLLLQCQANVNRKAVVAYQAIDPPPTALEVAAAVCNREVFDVLRAQGARLLPRTVELAERREGAGGPVGQYIRDILLPPLHRAACEDDAEALRRLTNYISFEAKDEFIRKEEIRGMTPLHLAAEAGLAENCVVLVTEFNDSEDRHPHVAWGWYGRMYMRFRFSNPFDDLLQESPQKELPLHLAARVGSEGACRAMLRPGVPQYTRQQLLLHENLQRELPLHLAARAGSEGVCRAMLGPEVPQYTRQQLLLHENTQKELPLHLAARAGSEGACRAMLRPDVPKDLRQKLIWKKDAKGQIPLAVAVLEGFAQEGVCRSLEEQHLDRPMALDARAFRIVIPSARCGITVKDAFIQDVHENFHSSSKTAAHQWNSHEKCTESMKIRPGGRILCCNTQISAQSIDQEFQRGWVQTLIFDMLPPGPPNGPVAEEAEPEAGAEAGAEAAGTVAEAAEAPLPSEPPHGPAAEEAEAEVGPEVGAEAGADAGAEAAETAAEAAEAIEATEAVVPA